jgi:hypothetical protein
MSKMGRPTKYSPEVGEVVFDLMDDGLSVVQVARKLNIGRSTLYLWASENPDFMDTFTRAREASEACWEYKFTDMMKDRNVNAPLVKLYFCNRFKWSEQDQAAQEAHAEPKSIQVEIVDARKPD